MGVETFFKCNINTTVKVKLTDLGYQHLADIHNELGYSVSKWPHKTADYFKSQADEEGYTTFQLWGFIEDFGGVTGLGKPSYYHADILIDGESLKKIK